MACTVKVSNVSPKATIREIEEFFSCSGQIEGINLNSDGEDSQTAYVTFKDHDSMKMALLLSGSAILDKEVDISAFSKPGTEELAPDYGNDSPEAGESSAIQGRPGAINKVQGIVTTMLSRGLSVGKDAMMRKAHGADEKSKKAIDVGSDASTKSMSESSNPKKRGGDVGDGESKIKSNIDIKRDANEEAGKLSMTPGGDEDDAAGQVYHESKPKSNNVRERVQKCYDHVRAVNEKLQIGQRTMSVLASAQQGVVSASAAVANNKFVAAGGGWVSGALSRVPLINRNAATVSHDGKGTSPPHQEQLTEMTSFPTHKT